METLLKYKQESALVGNDKKFYLKNGELTRYSFACGYIQRAIFTKENTHNIYLELWQELACFHIIAHDYGTLGRMFRESFDTLSEARKAFHAAKAKIRNENFNF